MKRNSINDVAFPPTNIQSSLRDRLSPPAKTMVEQASLGPPVITNLQPDDSIRVPQPPQVSSKGNKNTKASFPSTVTIPPTTHSALVSPALQTGQPHIHRRSTCGPRRRQTPRYCDVPPERLELLLDNAASLTKMLQGMAPGVRRPSWSHPDDDPVALVVLLEGMVDERNDVQQGSDEEVIDDDSASAVASFDSCWIDGTVKYSPRRARSAGIWWRHHFLNRGDILHQRTIALVSDFDASSSDDDIAPTA